MAGWLFLSDIYNSHRDLTSVFTSTIQSILLIECQTTIEVGDYSIHPANILRQILLRPLLPLPLQSPPLALPALLRFCMVNLLRQARRTQDT
jgi:hypothetical protein